jgi:chromosome partitioning protein
VKTLLLSNQKGGVGKSAVASLLAHYFAQKRQRVLVLDLDHQGNTSHALRRSNRPAVTSFDTAQLFTGQPPALLDAPFVLVPNGSQLLLLEREKPQHTPFARSLHRFIHSLSERFDVCVIDTNPNPDIRLIAATASADYVLSPIQLNQEAIHGVAALLNHDRVGLHKIKQVLNAKLELIGLLPTMVEATPYQKANFVEVVQRYHRLMIKIGEGPGAFAAIPRRSVIAEAQAEGTVL